MVIFKNIQFPNIILYFPIWALSHSSEASPVFLETLGPTSVVLWSMFVVAHLFRFLGGWHLHSFHCFPLSWASAHSPLLHKQNKTKQNIKHISKWVSGGGQSQTLNSFQANSTLMCYYNIKKHTHTKPWIFHLFLALNWGRVVSSNYWAWLFQSRKSGSGYSGLVASN